MVLHRNARIHAGHAGTRRAHNIATICFIGSLVATPLSSSSTSVTTASDDTIYLREFTSPAVACDSTSNTAS